MLYILITILDHNERTLRICTRGSKDGEFYDKFYWAESNALDVDLEYGVLETRRGKAIHPSDDPILTAVCRHPI
jgi:hypothetical protein